MDHSLNIDQKWTEKTSSCLVEIRKVSMSQLDTLIRDDPCPGRRLALNFCKKAVECGEKNNFHRVFLTSFCGE